MPSSCASRGSDSASARARVRLARAASARAIAAWSGLIRVPAVVTILRCSYHCWAQATAISTMPPMKPTVMSRLPTPIPLPAASVGAASTQVSSAASTTA